MATKNNINATDVNHTLLLGTGSGYSSLANGTTGQFLGANTGSDPSWQSLSSGNFLQIVTASSSALFNFSTAIPIDDTIPQQSEGTEILTASITPLNASSTLLIEFTSSGQLATDSGTSALAIFVDSTADAIAACYGMGTSAFSTVTQSCVIACAVSAGSTSARTYKIRAGVNGAMNLNGFDGSRVFGGVASTLLTIMEIAP